MIVLVHLYTQSHPVVVTDVYNTYQKGDLFCVMKNIKDGIAKTEKFPIQHIFRVTEEAPAPEKTDKK